MSVGKMTGGIEQSGGGIWTRLRRLLRPGPLPVPPAPERPIYAVGDIHGRVDLLMDLAERILVDAAGLDARPEVVFLGDFLDRGDEGRETVEFMIEMTGWPEIDVVPLLGNHEKMLLDFLDDPERVRRWIGFGGLQTLTSYGVRASESTADPAELIRIRDELSEAMGPHVDFLEQGRFCHLSGNVLLVHAGADPALPPTLQEPKSLLWGHRDFPAVPRRDGLWVVHGHNVVPEPRADRGVVSVDTGAYVSGRLTAARILPGESVRFLQTGAGGTERA